VGLTQAQDVVQDVFLRAHRAFARLRADSNPRAWLYRIATNSAYDHLRRRRRAALTSLAAAEALAVDGGPEQWLGESEPVHRALALLPPCYRVPLLLHACAGRSLSEIAGALGCSCGAVKMRLLRARARFRQIYQGSGERV